MFHQSIKSHLVSLDSRAAPAIQVAPFFEYFVLIAQIVLQSPYLRSIQTSQIHTYSGC